MAEADEDGQVQVFFELNGQPRRIKVANRSLVAKTERRPQADSANPMHVGAPMPGVISSVTVTVGQTVEAGDPLCTIEAMKMETSITTDQAGTVKAIHVGAGAQVDAKDLLVELE